MNLDQAHARSTDPRTSHEAAVAATVDLSATRRLVLRFALNAGTDGFTDFELEDWLGDHGANYRTRRCELRRMGMIRDTGRTMRPNGRQRRFIIWEITRAGMSRIA